jgi:arylsulfatase A-like enzyme
VLPPRSGWARLIASPSSYLLVVAFALTVWAKASILSALDAAGTIPLLLAWIASADALVLFALAALFALGEASTRWISAVTTALSACVLALALINAGYLSVSGEQLTVSTLKVGLARWDDFWGIAAEHARRLGRIRLLGLGLLAVALPVAVRALLYRVAGPWQQLTHGRQRAHCAGVIALGGLLVWVLAPEPRSLPVRSLGGSAILSTYLSWAAGAAGDGELAGSFAGYQPPAIVDDAELFRFTTRPQRPNVLLMVWESTRYDVTGIGGPNAPARTPNLMALAAQGLVAPRARAVVPHTTKSLFSILCARFPIMQAGTYEVSPTIHTQCLPRILSGSGYRTAFLQSALGSFEDRPRLVDRLGFDHFEAWEEIRGEPLGYLASSDDSLAPALSRWLDTGGDQRKPFFATLLTSSPHHPYQLPETAVRRIAASGAPAGNAHERYARLVEEEDALLGDVLEALRRRSLLDDTIIIVVGDHGEGLGEKGVRQHDSNFYEEGLRVPLVIAGPGVPHREIEGNVSLVDITPTLLGLLGIRPSERAALTIEGRDVLRSPPPDDQPRYFVCWFETHCRGFVIGTRKVVEVPRSNSAFWFDLAVDPDEQHPRRLTPELRALLPALRQVVHAHQTRTWPFELTTTRRYGEWRCPPGKPCRHPATPPGGLFRRP